MKNPHIIIDGNLRCLCGVYSDNDPVSCSDILNALDRVSSHFHRNEQSEKDIKLLQEAIRSLLKDCE